MPQINPSVDDEYDKDRASERQVRLFISHLSDIDFSLSATDQS
jgi:hypothetical protein